MSARRVLVGLVVLGAIVGLVALAYLWISGGSGAASGEITAPTAVAESGTVFEIVPEESEVRFLIFEELGGQPNTVVGRTDQVAGQIVVDFDNPAASVLGPIRVNVRTLVTDSEFRNRAIRSEILRSNEFEFADFVPTSLEGLPDTITMGTPISFTINGDLTVRDVTLPVTFEARVTPIAETRLQGLATATVLREDYGLDVPSVPNVANVANEVGLEIEFTAQVVDPSAADATAEATAP